MRNFNIIKMLILPKIINKFIIILIKMPIEFVCLWLVGWLARWFYNLVKRFELTGAREHR